MKNATNRLAVVLVGVLVVLDGILWYFLTPLIRGNASFALDFLNIGQGDSELMLLPYKSKIIKILIDAGPNAQVLSEIQKIVPPYDRYIDLVLLTHPQLDHFGGFIDLLKYYDVGFFLSNGRRGETKAYGDLVRTLQERHVRELTLGEGDRIRYGNYLLTLLGPSKKDIVSKELNDTCLVVKLEGAPVTVLYTGDIGANIEHELVQKYDLTASVLKVGHHGSRFSSSQEFLEAVKPKMAVIEVGKNTYGHPTAEALSNLEGVGSKIFRTDKDGLIRVVAGETKAQVFTERTR